MKNNKTKLQNYFVFAIIFFSSILSFAQPVVRVPSTCNVVVAGTGVGAVTGFGGQVGNGGIVCMPDPFDDSSSAGNFNVITNGTTITGWSLLGDLSAQTPNNPPSSGIYSAGAVTLLNIQSYNKNLRPAEYAPLYPLSNAKWARSKGRVTLSYSANPCGGSITFEVLKKYDNISPSWVPPIVGPDCIEPNKTYTFSVDQIASDNANDAIGFDKYYWFGIPSGATNTYTSADNSSITFTTGPSVTQTTLKCYYGRCNDWDADTGSVTTGVSKTLNVLPTQPSFSSSQPLNSCLNTGVTSFPIVIFGPVASYTYTLTAPGTPWVITNNSLGNWTVTTGTDNNPGTLILSVNNGFCAPVTFPFTINRNFVAPSASISAPTCVTAGTTNNAFSILTNAVLNPTTWTLPAGWSVTAGSANSTNSAFNVTVPAGTPAGAYTVTAKSNSCPGIISRVVNVRPATPVFTATSPTCVTRGTTPITNIAISPIAGISATGYTWTLPTGWTCSANCNTVNPTFIPNGTTAGPVTLTVTVTGTGGCNSTASRIINYNPVAPNSITTSCFNFGVAGSTTVTVANRPSPFFGTYTVTSSPTGLFSTYSVNATGIITLNTLATASGIYNLTITHNSPSCGSSSTTFPVTVAGNGASVAITANVPGAGNCDQYNISGAPVGSTFAWFVNGVQVTNSLTVNIFGTTLTLCGNSGTPSSVCVNVTSGGCTTRVCAPVVGTHSAKNGNLDGNGTKNNLLDKIKIYPNPTDGNFSILVTDYKESATALLADSTGKEIASYNLSKGENKIENESIASGTYLVILQVDGKQETRQLIVK